MKKDYIFPIIIASILLVGCDPASERDLLPTPAEPGPNASSSNAQIAYRRANEKMHKAMGVIHEDPDIAFIQGMIPHHQGAVDMANIILQYGDDEEARKLARNIIKTQEEEIAWMENWLKERNLKPIAVPQGAENSSHSAMGH